MSEPVNTKLTVEERVQLLQIITLPGWAVLMKLMEMKCVLQDNVLMGVAGENERMIVSEHRKSQAMWDFFGTVKKQAEYEVRELIEAEDAEKQEKQQQQQGARSDT